MSLFSKIFMLVALLVAPDASSKKMLADAYEATSQFCSKCYYAVMDDVVGPVADSYFPDHEVDRTRETLYYVPLVPNRFLAAASSLGLVGWAAFYKNKEWHTWATQVVRDIPALGQTKNAYVSAALAFGILAMGASATVKITSEVTDVAAQAANRMGRGRWPSVKPSVGERVKTAIVGTKEKGRPYTWRNGAKGLLTAASVLSLGALLKKGFYRG